MLLVVIDERIGRAAGPVETLVAFSPASVGIEVLNGWRALDQGCVFCHQIRCQCAQWRDVVDDPNAASMSRKHQVGLVRMYHKITHSHRGKIACLVLRPMLAAIY